MSARTHEEKMNQLKSNVGHMPLHQLITIKRRIDNHDPDSMDGFDYEKRDLIAEILELEGDVISNEISSRCDDYAELKEAEEHRRWLKWEGR